MSFKKVDALSADILDENFLKVFEPLHFVQTILGFHRVKIAYRFVTESSINYKFYSCILWTIHSISLITNLNCSSILGSAKIDVLLRLSLAINGIFNTFIAWQNNFCSEELNSKLYVKLQKIDRELKMSNAVLFNKRLTVLSYLVTFAGTLACFTWTITCSIVVAQQICYSTLLIMTMSIANCYEIFLLWIILLFLIIRVTHVNNILRAKLSLYTSDTPTEYNKKDLWTVNYYEKSENSKYQELVYSVYSILDTLADVTKLFRFPVFAFTTQVLLCNLALVQCYIDSVKEKVEIRGYLWASTIPVQVCLGTIVLVISITAGYLTSSLERTRKLSLNIKSLLNNGPIRRKAKKMLRTIETNPPRFSVYGMWDIEGMYLLHLFSTITTMFVTELQLLLL
ncbi:uncharacterized protein LOC114352578 isoform X2 [Ostrinia furnacalis]|uniref:uncharacterized protein LOC114352578 isoform X2 n=1 Tax=Ostrinia furnacalis TaxID=93504 RepID=UPI00103FA977|nr:uncharacterized protein LOC114352578 isoform X2 [Ostrinia furnacalis]